ncbi:MAG: hypothetical protein JXQ90_18910 [Cyclobacteriaceae bacterium]
MIFSSDISTIPLLLGLLVSIIVLALVFQKNVRKWSRLISSAVMLLALWGIYLSPTLPVDKQSISYYLETNNATSPSIDSLIELGYQGIQSLGEIDTSAYLIENLVVLGDGLSPDVLKTLTLPFSFLPGKTEKGIIALQTTALIEQNVPATITAKTNVRDTFTLKVQYAGGAKKLPIAKADFSFEILIPTPGHHLLNIAGTQENDTLFSEMYPVEVLASSTKQCLILTDAPSTEVRYLKNGLSKLGYGVALKQKISNELFHYEFSNINELDLRSGLASKLKQFSLVFTDAQSLAALNSSEKRELYTLVKQGVLGVIHLGSPSSFKIPTQPLTITDEHPDYYETQLRDGDIEVMINKKLIGETIKSGLGRLTYPYVQNTYQLILQGKEKRYQEIWQAIIDLTSPLSPINSPFLLPKMGFVNEGFEIGVFSETSPQLFVDSTEIKLTASVRDQLYFTKHWPSGEGWIHLSSANNQTNLMILGEHDWKAKRQSELQKYNQLYATSDQSALSQVKQTQQPISKWLFFIAFLVSAGYLWLESRL